MSAFLVPDSLGVALTQRAAGAMVLAGGTDYFPSRVGRSAMHPAAKRTLAIHGLDALRGVTETADGFRIGAATTWTELSEANLPPAFDALKSAAREVGVESPTRDGPYGAKGVGEPALISTAPAIFGGIFKAAGVRARKIPVLPHRLRAAILEKHRTES